MTRFIAIVGDCDHSGQRSYQAIVLPRPTHVRGMMGMMKGGEPGKKCGLYCRTLSSELDWWCLFTAIQSAEES